MAVYEIRGMGWLPDFPDFRDFKMESEEVEPLFMKTGILKVDSSSIPTKVDLRKWCPPVEDQGNIGSCTANAGVGLVEYYERRAFGRHIDASRLFLYKVTRNLLHWTGDTGAFLRTTMQAMVIFGVPPEEYWPYDITKYDIEPPAFCYSFAQMYQAIKYVRLDQQGMTREDVLNRIRVCLSAGLPAMFGFTVFRDALKQADKNGMIPFPAKRDRSIGGHAVVAVGYDDNIKIKNTTSDQESTGAFLIRNSWGEEWGDHGYGWLPYDYVRTRMAVDWWTLVRNEWIDTGVFKL